MNEHIFKCACIYINK